MVVQYTRYRIDGSRRQAFLDAHRVAGRHLQFRCIRYELTHCPDDCDWYTLRIEWESTEQLRRFLVDREGQSFRQAVSGFARDVQEQRQWELTDVVHKPMVLAPEVSERLGALLNRPPWNRLYRWILEHLDGKILVDQMAETVHMSPRNFARVFQRQFRMPPGEFLDRVRVALAKSDLKEGVEGIEQIAITRGFGSSSTMRRAFLRVIGVPPSQYRERISFDAASQADSGTAPERLRDFPVAYFSGSPAA